MMQSGIATDRLVFFTMTCFLGFHLCTCLWIFCATFFGDSFEENWMMKNDLNDDHLWNTYSAAAYETITMSCGAT